MGTRHRAELLQAFADALPFGAYVLDENGVVVIWNHAAERITGHLSQSLLGRAFEKSLLVPADGEGVSDGAAQRGDAELELFFRHREGHRIPVHAYAVELRSEEEGRHIGSAEFFHDKVAVAEGSCWLHARGGSSRGHLGIPAYETSRQQLRIYLEERWNKLGVFVVRVRQLADFKKHCGREMVHVTLRTVAQTITNLLTLPNYLGVWEGDQFLTLVPECPRERFGELARKLETVGSACEISWWGDSIVPYVEVEGAYVEDAESAQELMLKMRVAAATATAEESGEPDRCS